MEVGSLNCPDRGGKEACCIGRRCAVPHSPCDGRMFQGVPIDSLDCSIAANPLPGSLDVLDLLTAIGNYTDRIVLAPKSSVREKLSRQTGWRAFLVGSPFLRTSTIKNPVLDIDMARKVRFFPTEIEDGTLSCTGIDRNQNEFGNVPRLRIFARYSQEFGDFLSGQPAIAARRLLRQMNNRSFEEIFLMLTIIQSSANNVQLPPSCPISNTTLFSIFATIVFLDLRNGLFTPSMA